MEESKEAQPLYKSERGENNEARDLDPDTSRYHLQKHFAQ